MHSATSSRQSNLNEFNRRDHDREKSGNEGSQSISVNNEMNQNRNALQPCHAGKGMVIREKRWLLVYRPIT